MNPLLLVDFYKPHHNKMYPEGMRQLYSNFTPRKSRIPGVDKVVWFGLQHFVLEYLIKAFNEHFFGDDFTRKNKWAKARILREYEKHVPVDTKHIGDLWDLGFLPVLIKALPEGTQVPIGVPCLTIQISDPEKYGQHAWVVNYLETLMSCMLWQPTTSATIAYEYKKLLTRYALETTGTSDFVQWQGHDFSMRGMSSVESAILSGMGHLTSFTGTDTIPAIYQLEKSYRATGLIGASVPATEHSVMCMGTKESEIDTFKRLLALYPTGILSVVSDTWDLWKVLTEYLPAIKSEIIARDGKLVIRPDSGDPVDIICGINTRNDPDNRYGELAGTPEYKGVIELLWDVFGGKVNKHGYKELDSHIGAIYGDSITIDRAKSICERLKAKGFASTNVVFGIGSYTYQYNTRDTFGFAMKATYGEIVYQNGSALGQNWVESREIFKDPVTDDGTKKSKKGLLTVVGPDQGYKKILCQDQCTNDQEKSGMLEPVFENGQLLKFTTLEEIRNKLK